MDKCNIFLSKKENYQKSAEKIKNSEKARLFLCWLKQI